MRAPHTLKKVRRRVFFFFRSLPLIPAFAAPTGARARAHAPRPVPLTQAALTMDDASPALASTPFPLTPAHHRAFAADGFVRLPAFFAPADLAAGRAAVGAALAAAPPAPPLEDDAAYAAAFTQVMNLWEAAPAVAAFAFCPRLAGAAASLLDTPAVRVYHDQSLTKPPGAGPTAWHADGYYWPLAAPGGGPVKAVTAWIPLDEGGCPPERGPLEFAAGSHAPPLAAAVAQGIGTGSEAALGAEIAARGCPIVGGGFAPGEISLHSAWTTHRAPPNASAAPRRVFTVIFIAADTVAAAPAHANHIADYDRWLGGLACVAPGEGLGRCPKTPVVFSAGATAAADAGADAAPPA